MPDQFFTPTNIASVGAATAIVTVVINTLHAFAPAVPTKVPALAVSILLAYLAVLMENAPMWYEWVFAFFNACLLFCSALGLNEMASRTAGQGFNRGAGFFQSWFK